MFNLFRKKIGILGYGNMGSAIAEGIKARYAVCVFDKEKSKITGLKGIASTDSSRGLVELNEVIILAIKPQDFDILLNEVKYFLQDKLVISIAAGVTTGYLEEILGQTRVIRVMPNLAVSIAEGETCICKGRYAKAGDLWFTKGLFKILGKVWELKEEKLNAATAISGSGPAYILLDMEINKIDPLRIPLRFEKVWIHNLHEAALAVGINPKIAQDLSASTTTSTIHLAKHAGNSPAELRKLITSPGGTTEAALKVITDGGSWPQAALAAKKRAQELSKRG